jgi:hypothetical protein
MVGLGVCAIFFVWVIDGPAKDIKLRDELEKIDKEKITTHEKSKLDKLQTKYPANNIKSGFVKKYKGRKEILLTKTTKIYKLFHPILLLVVELFFCGVFIHLLKVQVNSDIFDFQSCLFISIKFCFQKNILTKFMFFFIL